MLSFLSSCEVSNPHTLLLTRTTPSRYPPHTAYGLTTHVTYWKQACQNTQMILLKQQG